MFLLLSLTYRYFLLFFWSFFAATIFPGTSEFYLVYLVQDEQLFWLPVLVATLGNTIGGVSTYYLGYFTANYLEDKKQISSKFNLNKKALAILQKYGSFALIFSWIPLLGDIIVGFAGALKLPKTSAFLWMTLGKFLRYAAIALSTLGVVSLVN